MNTYTILKGLLKVTPKNDVRYYLNGVLVTPEQLIATDNHQLMRVDYAVEGVSDNIILCRHDIDRKLKLFSKKESPTLEVVDGKPYLGGYEIKTIDGRFPDVNRVISAAISEKGRNGECCVDLTLLSNLSQAVAIVSDAKFKTAKLTVKTATTAMIIERQGVFALLMPCRMAEGE